MDGLKKQAPGAKTDPRRSINETNLSGMAGLLSPAKIIAIHIAAALRASRMAVRDVSMAAR